MRGVAVLAVVALSWLPAALGSKEGLWTSMSIGGESRLRSLSESQRRIMRGLSVRLNPSLLRWESTARDGSVLLELPLPSGEYVTFKLLPTSIMHPELAAKFPDIKTFSGESQDFERSLVADVDYSPSRGVSALIIDNGEQYYVDPFHPEENEYKVYSGRQARQNRLTTSKSSEPWRCGGHDGGDGHEHEEESDDMGVMGSAWSLVEPEQKSSKAKIYSFTLALMANGQYSKFHGNTKRSVLGAMVTVMNRVNGIYKRELGVFFQLHRDTDKLICLHPCKSLANSASILSQMAPFASNQGVRSSSYDIGHSLTTGSGGLAYLRSLCSKTDRIKAGGTTGLAYPQSDVFYVDYVSHELGHQLNGKHSFSDCSGHFESPSQNASPVEPGSGSTIMSYAGICGKTDLQSNTDPIFHSKNIEEMREFVALAVSKYEDCGSVQESTVLVPETMVAKACDVPAGNYFQLAMRNPDPSNFFTFETVDMAYTRPDFKNRAVPRFRSWVPTHRPKRYFPNMYYIIHEKVDQVKDEVVPVSETSITFRGTTRTHFNSAPLLSDGNGAPGGFGANSFSDVSVQFKNLKPLAIEKAAILAYNWGAGEKVNFKWDAGESRTLASRVGVFLAVHDPAMNYKGTEIDYVDQVVDLDWIKVGESSNKGSVLLSLPRLPGQDSGELTVHVMLRSMDQDECFFFDVVPFVTYHNSPLVPAPEYNEDKDGSSDLDDEYDSDYLDIPPPPPMLPLGDAKKCP